ncbi:MAG: OmpA family protein [Treponema sp.]|nr:OmpA family protein [Treponema sp.]
MSILNIRKKKITGNNTINILCFLFIVHCSLFIVPLHAEHEVSLRVAPVIETPVNIPVFNTGLGANASLDWAFLQFNKFNFGLSAAGSFVSLPFETGDPLNLMSGSLGLFLRYRPFDRFAFRIGGGAGIYQYNRSGENAANLTFSGALGLEFYLLPYFSLFADSSYTYRFFSSEPFNSFGISAGLRINLSEIMSGKTRLHVEKTEQYRVFPVSWAWYENNPVAMVRVTNDEPNAITDVRLSLYMDSYMSQPWTFAVVPYLASGVSIDIPVTALFNEAMMNLTETVNANGQLQTQYRSLGAGKETSSVIQMPIFHRNTLSWDDDRRAAAFVSPNDFAARYFSRYVQTGINNILSVNAGMQNNTPSNVLIAAAMFETLRLYGITYIIVPATSFANVSADESVLDNVSFPYQALHYRGGDCSYLSILFCSLLEAAGIETAFITIPGHIYIAFETGDDFWYAYNDDIIELNGKRWLPVELTAPELGFTGAWRSGARQWRNNGEDARLYPIREAWEIYPSVTVPASGDHLPQMPQWDAINSSLEREVGLFRWGDTARNAAQRERNRLQEETTARRQALVEDITAIIAENNVRDTRVQATAEGVMITLSNIQFAADSWELPDREREKLLGISRVLRNIPNVRLIIAGHTTHIGSVENLLELSAKRAQEVANYLIWLGACRESNITVVGHGGARPIANRNTQAGQAANRRVEITIVDN